MKLIPLLAVLLALGASACDENPLSPTQIRDVTWKLEVIERAGSPTITIPNPDQYTLRFDDNGQLAVRADCNSCGGRYTLDGASLSVSAVACTKVFCGQSSFDTSYAHRGDGHHRPRADAEVPELSF